MSTFPKAFQWSYAVACAGLLVFFVAFEFWPRGWPTRYLAAYFIGLWAATVALIIAHWRFFFWRR